MTDPRVEVDGRVDGKIAAVHRNTLSDMGSWRL